MSVWCAKVVLCLILLAEAFPRIPGSTGLDGLHVDTVREFLPTSVAPGIQAHALNPAGFSWYLLQALQYIRVRRVGHRDIAFCESFSVVGCGESHWFRSGLPDLCQGSLSAIFPRRLKCTSWLLTLLLLVSSISCLCLTTILQSCVYTVMRYQAPLASRLVLYEDACRDAVRMIPPSWSLIKWLCQKPGWNRSY